MKNILSFLFLGAVAMSTENIWAGECARTLSNEVRVAAVQYPIAYPRSPENFLENFRDWVEAAKKSGADLVVFPELIVLDLLDPASPDGDSLQLQKIAAEFTPQFFSYVSTLAKELEISILAGSSPRWENGVVHNTALLAFSNGKQVTQDKIYLTPDEKNWGWTPGSTLKVFEAPWGKTSILICLDSEFPQLSQSLVQARPELILIPSMTGSDFGLRRVQWSAQARAVEHYTYVVHTGTVSKNETHSGQASLLNPQEPGFPRWIARGRKNESSLVIGTLDMKFLREKRPIAGIYPAREQMVRPPPKIEITH